jgi:hypothetical protein
MASEKDNPSKLKHKENNFLLLAIVFLTLGGGILYCVNPNSKEYSLPIITALIGYYCAKK